MGLHHIARRYKPVTADSGEEELLAEPPRLLGTRHLVAHGPGVGVDLVVVSSLKQTQRGGVYMMRCCAARQRKAGRLFNPSRLWD